MLFLKSQTQLKKNSEKFGSKKVIADSKTNLKEKKTYAIPVRKVNDDCVKSYFSGEELMAMTLYFNQAWKTKHAHFLYDFQDDASVKAYIEACEAAHSVPPLTDEAFYKSLIENNGDKFGSIKALAKQKS